MAARGILRVKIIGDERDLAGALKRAQGRVQSFSKDLTNVGKRMSLGVTTPLVGAGVAAFKFASDLNEATSKVSVVFGENAKVIDKWAEGSAEAFGLSKAEALDAIGTIGNLFTALKLPQNEATKMSKKVIELAGDLASFNNVSVDEALTALSSGLVGETEPLKRLGVNMNEATLKQKALDLGLIKTAKGTLPAAVKAQAAYALILEQTKTAQGDYARTADGAANRQRTLFAQFKNTAAVLGTHLLPIGQKILGFVSGLLEKFGNLSPTVQRFVIVGAGIAAALGPALTILGSLGTAIAFIASPIGAVVAGLAVLTFAFVSAWKNSEAFRDRVRGVIENVKVFIAGLVERFRAMVPFFKSVWDVIVKTAKRVLETVGKIIGGLIEKFGPFLQKFIPFVARVIGEAFKIAGKIIQTLAPIVEGIASVVGSILKTLITVVARIINAIIRSINAVIRGINLVKPGKDIGTLSTIDVNALFSPGSKGNASGGGVAGGPGSTIGGVSKFHSGGVVPGTPLQERLALLRGGEKVLPPGGADARPLIVNIYPQNLLSTKEELFRDLRDYLLKTGRLNARLGLV